MRCGRGFDLRTSAANSVLPALLTRLRCAQPPSPKGRAYSKLQFIVSYGQEKGALCSAPFACLFFFLHPADVGAQGVEFIDQMLVAPLDEVDVFHVGGSFGGKACDDQSGAGPEIMGIDDAAA